MSNQVGGDHYQKSAIQPIEYIEANNLTFSEGNVVKYVSRHRFKNGAEDMKKALDYCTRILKREYGIDVKVEFSETGKKIVF